jgi:hypothetical protein
VDRGDCHVVTYLRGFTTDEIERLMERIADVLIEEMGVTTGDDEPVRALIGAKPLEFPDWDGDEEIKTFLDGHSIIVIPTEGDGDE